MPQWVQSHPSEMRSACCVLTALLGFPAGEPYKGTSEQKDILRRSYERKVEFMREHKVPVSPSDLLPMSPRR